MHSEAFGYNGVSTSENTDLEKIYKVGIAHSADLDGLYI